MADITITMRLFGAFRKYGENVTFTVPRGATTDVVKNELAVVLKMPDNSLIKDSVIANDSEIMDIKTALTQDCRLAILPPVCGG